MSLFYNNYKKLVYENEVEYLKIPVESHEALDHMFKYLKTFDLSFFELEVIKKDLIGLAKEADKEGVLFADKLGMPEKEFCDSLVNDSVKSSYLDYSVPMIRDIIIMIFAVFTINWVFSGMPKVYGIAVETVGFGLAMGLMEYIVLRRLERKKEAYSFTGTGKKKKRFYQFSYTFMIVVTLIGTQKLLGNAGFIIRGNGRVIFFILLALSIAAFFGNNYYWDKCSEGYNWR